MGSGRTKDASEGTPAWDLVQSAQMQESALLIQDASEGTPAWELVQSAQMQETALEVEGSNRGARQPKPQDARAGTWSTMGIWQSMPCQG